MKRKNNLFNKASLHERGGMMIELMLTLALFAIVLPFIINFQKSRIDRAENIVIAKDMDVVKNGLEKYIDIHKQELLKPINKNITRISLEDLTDYGISSDLFEKYGDNFQIRIIKTNDRNGHATLQGILVLNDKKISPIRTREIVNLGNNNLGFVEQDKTFGAFGTWHGDAVDFGIGGLNGVVQRTETKLDSEEYLWRLPSENESDATMLSDLNLGGHNIINVKFMDSDSAKFEETLNTQKIVSENITFQNKATIDNKFNASDAVVSGALYATSRNMNVTNTFNLADTAKLSSLYANNLWVNNLNLSGISISTEDGDNAVILKVNKVIDMVAGHITAMFVSVGFDGSITPKLIIKNKIEDSSNPNYVWDVSNSNANLYDISCAELTRMAGLVISKEYDSNTKSSNIFKTVVSNNNATASYFMNAISENQTAVKTKYGQLNLD